MRGARLVLAGAFTAILAACGGGGGSSSSTGTLKLGVTDAPVDVATQVVVQFTGVELKPVGGKAFSIDFAAPQSIDLLDQQGTQRAMLLGDATVPAGNYEWLRLKVNAEPNVVDSFIAINAGDQCELRIPSGAETGLKVIHGFTVGVGSVTDLTIDFDLRKSVVQPPGQKSEPTTCGGQAYLLKPVLRIVDNLQVGAIAGTVDSNLIGAGNCPTSPASPGNVYLFGPYLSGTDPVPVPDDYDQNPDDAPGPIASAKVDPNTFTYTIGFVPEGQYVVAYTCDVDNAMLDANVIPPGGTVPDEVVNFTSPQEPPPVNVVRNQTTMANFVYVPPPAP
ncbi:MAG TPA: DUF4382 domain-containing protein [Steroidobacteraceae bacterium]